jgi:hypothetical protein
LNGKQIIKQNFKVTNKNISIKDLKLPTECNLQGANLFKLIDLHPSKNISLYDQKGSKIPLSNKTNIDLSILPKGIYYI